MGATYLAYIVLSVKEGGFIWASPECKTYLSFLSRHTFKRCSAGFAIVGDESLPAVKSANFSSVLLSWLLVTASIRNVFWAVENPLNSLLYQVPWMSECILTCAGKRFTTSLGSFGGSSRKMLEIYSTAPAHLVERFLLRKAERSAKRSRLTSESKGWTTGSRPDLKSSQCYPPEFASAVSELCAHLMGNHRP
eukprot:2391126-Pyramimonas_sp.AAC.2